MLYPHSKMATYWYRYFLFTPRNIRRKFRSPVHSPSSVFTWTSRTPSPSSSRAHSPAAWQTTFRAQPVSAIRSYPRQSSVLTTAGGSAAPRTTPLSVSPSECSVTVSRTAPLWRPTTPQIGGRSLSQVPWPGARFPRRRGGSSGSRCGTPFFPRILVHLVGLHHLVVSRTRQETPHLRVEPPRRRTPGEARRPRRATTSGDVSHCGVCSIAHRTKSVAGGSTPSRLSLEATWPRW